MLQTERRSGLGGRVVCKDDTEPVPTLLIEPGWKDCIPGCCDVEMAL